MLLIKALFTLRQNAPANRVPQLGGLKHSPPLHSTHLQVGDSQRAIF